MIDRLYSIDLKEVDEDLKREFDNDFNRPVHFGELWGSIMQDYTSLYLTFDQDILPALSSIASLMRSHDPGRYFAGI
jgi:hypothetical protein